jgi:hypothetical protein
MLDPGIRGWLLLLAGAAICAHAAHRHRGSNGVFPGLNGWGERLIVIMLMVQGGATHLEAAGDADLSWLYWTGFILGCMGVALLIAGRGQRTTAADDPQP